MKQVLLLSDWKKIAGPLFVLIMFLVALYFLHRELEHYRWNDFVQSFSNLPPHCVLSAIGLTVLNYLILIATAGGYGLPEAYPVQIAPVSK